MASTKYNACHFNYIKLLIYVANFRASLFLFFIICFKEMMFNAIFLISNYCI